MRDYSWIGTVAGYIVGGLVIGCFFTPDYTWHREAVAHHAAHYDAKSGDFKWNDQP